MPLTGQLLTIYLYLNDAVIATPTVLPQLRLVAVLASVPAQVSDRTAASRRAGWTRRAAAARLVPAGCSVLEGQAHCRH